MSFRLEPAEVASIAPNLTIRYGGSPTAVAALGISGQTLSPADRGMALIVPGVPPIFIETV